jgi:hypothetical protein
MSLTTTQSLSKDTATEVDTNLAVYAQRWADENKSVFSVAGLTAPAEKKLTVSHETGKAGEQRHMIRLDRTEVDAFGVAGTVSVYMVIVRPLNTALTNTIILEEVNRLVDFCLEGGVNANVVAVLNGEV